MLQKVVNPIFGTLWLLAWKWVGLKSLTFIMCQRSLC